MDIQKFLLTGWCPKKAYNGKRLCDGGFYTQRTFKTAIAKPVCLLHNSNIQINLYKNGIFRKFKYARKEESYATIICFGQFIRPSSRG